MRGAVYHLQQAIEKKLKAVLLLSGYNPPFSHDISYLIDCCAKVNIRFSESVEDIADTVTFWESKSRYDPYISFSQRKYEIAKAAYREISAETLELVNQIAEDSDDEDEDYEPEV